VRGLPPAAAPAAALLAAAYALFAVASVVSGAFVFLAEFSALVVLSLVVIAIIVCALRLVPASVLFFACLLALHLHGMHVAWGWPLAVAAVASLPLALSGLFRLARRRGWDFPARGSAGPRGPRGGRFGGARGGAGGRAGAAGSGPALAATFREVRETEEEELRRLEELRLEQEDADLEADDDIDR